MQVRASGSNPNYDSGNLTNALLYQNPTKPSVTTTPAIESIPAPALPINPSDPYNPFSNPTTLTTNTWGFAIIPGPTSPSIDLTNQPIATFSTPPAPPYAIDDPTNYYANIPITDTELYATDQQLTEANNFIAYYAAKVDTTKPAGTYSTTITYTVIGEEVPEPIYYLADVVARNNITTMQTLTAELCQSAAWDDTSNGANDNNTATLTDTRGNNQQYQVRKMADGNCWMVNNLNFNPTVGTELTPDDTNIISKWTIPADINNDEYSYTAPRIYGLYNAQTDHTQSDFYGMYYNWCAAKGGTPESCTDDSTDPTETSQDICPANWRLPRGSIDNDGNYDINYNEFAWLNAKMNNPSATSPSTDSSLHANWLFTGPFKGVFSGYRYDSAWGGQGSVGNFWLSSHYPGYSSNAFYLVFYSGGVSPDGVSNRGDRFAVRCLLAP